MKKPVIIALGIFCLMGTGMLFFSYENTSASDYLPPIFSALGLLLILNAFTERDSAERAWVLIILSQLFILLSVAFSESLELREIFIFLSGGTLAAVVGYICILKIKSIDRQIDLNMYHGYAYERPGLSLIFLVSGLALFGFPVSPTFIGLDILFSHIHKDQLPLIVMTSLSFVLVELAVLRIYIRIFLGLHKKPYHPMAFRSS